MNLKKAFDNLRTIKEEVLKDGHISEEEVKALLEFLSPYKISYGIRFGKLEKVLTKALKDGVENHQVEIIECLEDTENLLRFENKIERTIGYIIVFIMLCLGFWCLIR